MILLLPALLAACVSGGLASAEEYFSLGMAYFDLGRYAEAEKWLNRARMVDKTRIASEYNLGRIAYETGRFEDAARLFERILSRDPSNVMALKAAAYTRIKTGDIALAESLYDRVLRLEPESADDGYNYALVLYAMEKYEKAEEILRAYEIALAENNDVLLLYARSLAAQNKVEAADYYDQWLQNTPDPLVRYEYAQLLETVELYARALEQYREALNSLPQEKRTTARYTIARLLLIADSESEEGITELRAAVSEGFADTEELEALLDEPRIKDSAREEIRLIIDEIVKKAREAAEAEAQTEGEETEQEAAPEGPPGS